MPAETGRYCTYCTTDSGELQPFDERFARMVAGQQRRHPEQAPADAEAATLAYLATMPAWRDHPRVVGRGRPARRETSGGARGASGHRGGEQRSIRTCVRR